jgi:cytochrome c oxidase subunit II
MTRVPVGLLLGCAAVASAMAAPPDLSYCTVCHGAQGNGNPAIHAPKIAGIEPWYLKRQLTLFRAGHRGTQSGDTTGMAMQPMVLQLDDAAIDKVVAYVATFEPKQPARTVGGDARRGRSLYESCAGCHGKKGEGLQATGGPALAARSDWYLVTQLERFRTGLRGFAPEDIPGTQMRAATALLPDADAVRDVVAYINTL